VVETISELAILMKTHGAWALVAVAGVVIWRMAVYIQVIQQRHQDTIQKLLLDHNKEQKEETKQIVTVMTMTEKSLHAMNDTLNALMQRRE
jgi:low affinity Fe/Cu permease